MARRKNKKRIDPRYFLNETTYRDVQEEIDPATKKKVLDMAKDKNMSPYQILVAQFGDDVSKWPDNMQDVGKSLQAKEREGGGMPSKSAEDWKKEADAEKAKFLAQQEKDMKAIQAKSDAHYDQMAKMMKQFQANMEKQQAAIAQMNMPPEKQAAKLQQVQNQAMQQVQKKEDAIVQDIKSGGAGEQEKVEATEDNPCPPGTGWNAWTGEKCPSQEQKKVEKGCEQGGWNVFTGEKCP